MTERRNNQRSTTLQGRAHKSETSTHPVIASKAKPQSPLPRWERIKVRVMMSLRAKRGNLINVNENEKFFNYKKTSQKPKRLHPD